MKAGFNTVELLGPDGQPLRREEPMTRRDYQKELQAIRSDFRNKNFRMKYDAAQTVIGNERHWANVDYFDPHNAATLEVRRKLRARSRYEIIENNPYLKGTILSIVNDFVGSGPKLQITDKRISPARRRLIEQRWAGWAGVIKLRRKIWRGRIAKIVDGETFKLAYNYPENRHPIKLNFQVIECDRFSSNTSAANRPRVPEGLHEIDGVRFDNFENPVQYFLLNQHPGGSPQWYPSGLLDDGKWIRAQYVLHWFRQDRGWLRGIPELVPSLPLCALLRRYTIAVVRAAELIAGFAAVIETEGPADIRVWTDGNGNLVEDEPFDVFPIEHGMIMNMPWGYKLNQLKPNQPTAMYDKFVDSLLREIVRPLLTPFNIAAGSSADSNMASGVLDSHIYKSGQYQERLDCNDEELDPMFALWWQEAIRLPDYLDDPAIFESDFLLANPSMQYEPPAHRWRWDRIGVDHTDPLKCAQALEVLKTNGFMTDRDVQEEYYNRDIEDWREDTEEDMDFRKEQGLLDPKTTVAGAIAVEKAKPKPVPANGKKPTSSKKATAKKRT